MQRIIKKTKLGKKELFARRVEQAFKTAAKVILFLNVAELPVSVEIGFSENVPFKGCLDTEDFRELIVTSIGSVAASILIRNRCVVDREMVYQQLLEMGDTENLLDRITEEETKELVTVALDVLTKKWYAVEDIATQLLNCPPAEQRVINFTPRSHRVA